MTKLACLAATTAFLLTACPGGGDGTDGGPDGPASNKERLLDAYRAFFEDCDSGPRAPSALDERIEPGREGPGYSIDVDELIDQLREQLNDPAVQEDPDAAAACVEAWEAMAEECVFDPDSGATCSDAWYGDREPGESCEHALQCTNTNCVFDENDCGECQAFAGPGESCTNNICDPEQALVCRDGVCVEEPQDGDPCLVDGVLQECAEGFECDLDAEEPVCVDASEVQPPVEGDPCSQEAFNECDTRNTALACVADEGGEGTCTPIIAVEPGGTCNNSRFGYDYNAERWCLNGFTTHFCDKELGAEEGTCEERAAIGEDCAEKPCVHTASCETDAEGASTCVELPGEGEPCAGYQCGEGLYCDDDDFQDEEPGTCVSAFEVDTGADRMCMETDGGS